MSDGKSLVIVKFQMYHVKLMKIRNRTSEPDCLSIHGCSESYVEEAFFHQVESVDEQS